MNPAAVANTLWLASGIGASRRFSLALAGIREAQERWLRHQLVRHARSEFGRAHDFAAIESADNFAQRVPLTDYATLQPSIRRIADGEPDVLACGRVTHLVPTSGSTGAQKLVPFSASLQAAFSAAVRPWLGDLARQRPSLLGGPAYWSISPMTEATGAAGSTDGIPVGFADDAEYVGGTTAWLLRRALAVPAEVRHVRDATTFWRLTTLAMLRARELRLISAWHPSFVDVLVSAAAAAWPELLDAIATGSCPWEDALPPAKAARWRVPPDRARAAELRAIGPADWPRWWPRLTVVSCWGEQAAEAGWQRLRARLPGVLVQAKGLLATEAVVTIPYGGMTPLAVTSHFFEFIDQRGEVRLAHELERGGAYEVVVTNGGGFWRYRLGDMVECVGFLREAPCLRFLGRAGRVSDLRGEKLSEVFAAEVLRTAWGGVAAPAYAAFRANDDGDRAGYDLLVSIESLTAPPDDIAARIDHALSANPHYALARRLGQLAPLRVIPVSPDSAREELVATRLRIGETKPSVLFLNGD